MFTRSVKAKGLPIMRNANHDLRREYGFFVGEDAESEIGADSV